MRDHLRKQATVAAATAAAQARPTYGKTQTQTYAEWRATQPAKMTEAEADTAALSEWSRKPMAERYAYPGGYAAYRTKRRGELLGTVRVNPAG